MGARSRAAIWGRGRRHSLVGVLYPGDKPRAYVAIPQWFEAAAVVYLCVFDPAVTDANSGAFPRRAAALRRRVSPKACRKRFERQKQAMAERGMDLSRPLSTESCMVLRPRGLKDLKCGHGGAFLAGEAGGFISPSSLEGISWAIETARLVAESLSSPDPNRAYLRKTRVLRLKLLGKELKSAFLYRPALRSWVMRSGLKAISVDQTPRVQRAKNNGGLL